MEGVVIQLTRIPYIVDFVKFISFTLLIVDDVWCQGIEALEMELELLPFKFEQIIHQFQFLELNYLDSSTL